MKARKMARRTRRSIQQVRLTAGRYLEELEPGHGLRHTAGDSGQGAWR
jgi:hypothetical protein